MRSPGSAAAVCTATAPWKAPSSAAACSPAVRRAGPPRPIPRHSQTRAPVSAARASALTVRRPHPGGERPGSERRSGSGLVAGLALYQGHNVLVIQIRQSTSQPGPRHGSPAGRVPGEQCPAEYGERGDDPATERGAVNEGVPEGCGGRAESGTATEAVYRIESTACGSSPSLGSASGIAQDLVMFASPKADAASLLTRRTRQLFTDSRNFSKKWSKIRIFIA